MNRTNVRWFTAMLLTLAVGVMGLAGCGEVEKEKPKKTFASPPAKKTESKSATILAVRDKLSAEERKLVDAQEWCVSSEEPLGSMGAPIKVMVKDQPVYICCKHCEDDALLKDPEAALAKVKELQAKKAAQATSK